MKYDDLSGYHKIWLALKSTVDDKWRLQDRVGIIAVKNKNQLHDYANLLLFSSGTVLSYGSCSILLKTKTQQMCLGLIKWNITEIYYMIWNTYNITTTTTTIIINNAPVSEWTFIPLFKK